MAGGLAACLLVLMTRRVGCHKGRDGTQNNFQSHMEN
jgi:hypothetical protein